MIGKDILHYKILQELGRGGMGIVYRAHDNRLDRDVALKFLPHDLTSTEDEKARFLQEARAAATLNHAHICTIHAIEEVDGDQFIAMEYVEGITLRKKIGESGGMKVDDVVTLGVQIGDALHEAHSKGIVHRDVKAENIMVNHRNQAKVMDFGLAKLKGSLKLTKTSSTVGTLAYMAPEQIQGGEVDARSDIFSFGVVIFEMLTAHTPFRGEHEAAVMYSILNEDAEPVSKYIPDASSELIHILNRALEKDPEDRYQSVHDMVIDLRRLKKDSSRVSQKVTEGYVPPPSRGPVAGPKAKPELSPHRKKSLIFGSALALLAILTGVAYFTGMFGEGETTERLTVAISDFVNETSEPELDGLSGMLITSMEQSRRLTVITRARMFDILKQNGKEDVSRIDDNLGREVARTAGADALVSASIRKFGKLYTIDLKVLDPKKDEYIFTAKEEGEGQESIPQMLDRLSEKTRIGLKEKAHEVQELQQGVAEMTTSNLEAYQHYFRGEELINRMQFNDAAVELRKAVELDSSFGLAQFRLAYALGWFSDASTAGHVAQALRHIDRIPERDQFLLRAEEARLRLGMGASIGILKQMEQRYPDDKEMLYNIGDYSYHTGDYETALRYLTRTLSIDPKFERALQHLTWTYRDMGNFDQMLETARKYVTVSGSGDAYGLLGFAYSTLGRSDEGLQALQQARELFPDSWQLTRSIVGLRIDEGDLDAAEKETRSLLKLEGEKMGGEEASRLLSGLEALKQIRLYQGRMKEAESLAERQVQVNLQQGDSLAAANLYASGAWRSLIFEGDQKKARSLMKKSSTYPGFLSTPPYQSLHAMFSLLDGDLSAADSAMPKDFPLFRKALFALAAAMSGRCEEVERLRSRDSTWTFFPQEFQKSLLYEMARCQFENSSYEHALKSILELQGIRTRSVSAGLYPRSFYVAGMIYEAMGEKNKATQSYNTFLSIWKDADKDLPEYRDASARLKRLETSS